MKNEALFRTGSVWKYHHFHGGALHYHYPCHGAVQHGGYVFCGLSGRYRTGGGGLRCGTGVFDPCGSGDHAWRRQQRHHCTLLWRRRDRAGQDLLLALLLEQLFSGRSGQHRSAGEQSAASGGAGLKCRIFSLCRAVSSGPCTGCAAFYPVQQHGDAGACRGRSKRRPDRQSSGHAGQLHF